MADKGHDLREQRHLRTHERIAFEQVLAGGGTDCDRVALMRTKARSAMRAMSISRFGRASRMAMSGTRV
jgi:hypothetical protein